MGPRANWGCRLHDVAHRACLLLLSLLPQHIAMQQHPLPVFSFLCSSDSPINTIAPVAAFALQPPASRPQTPDSRLLLRRPGTEPHERSTIPDNLPPKRRPADALHPVASPPLACLLSFCFRPFAGTGLSSARLPVCPPTIRCPPATTACGWAAPMRASATLHRRVRSQTLLPHPSVPERLSTAHQGTVTAAVGTDGRLRPLQKTRSSSLHVRETGTAARTRASPPRFSSTPTGRMQPRLLERPLAPLMHRQPLVGPTLACSTRPPTGLESPSPFRPWAIWPAETAVCHGRGACSQVDSPAM